MAPMGRPGLIRFGVFEVDLGSRELFKSGHKVRLEAQPFRVLSILLEKPGQLVTRKELQQRLWPQDTFIDFSHSLNVDIQKLRQALGDSTQSPRFIETLPQKGYRFMYPVEMVGQKVAKAPPTWTRGLRDLVGKRQLVTHRADESESGVVLDGEDPSLWPQGEDNDSTHEVALRQKAKEEHSVSPRSAHVWKIVAIGAILIAVGIGLTWSVVRRFSTPSQAALTAVPLTSYPGIEEGPSFSPDSRQVAFCWNGERQDNFDIYVKLIGLGPPVRLTKDPAADISPAWSPDGRWIAFFRNNAGLFLIPALGGQERKLVEIKQTNGYSLGACLSWFPDSRWIVAWDESAGRKQAGLYAFSVDSGERRQLTSLPTDLNADINPSVSPDGHSLVFSRHMGTGLAELYLVSISHDLKPIGEPQRLTFEKRWTTSPVWTPDGREIVFSSGEGMGGRGLWKIAVPGRGGGLGIPERLPVVGEDNYAVTISRQGSRLIYSREINDINIWRVEVPSPQNPNKAGLDGKATAVPFIVSTRNEFLPQFSPDGKRIAFVSDRSGSPEIWVCSNEGSNPTQLTSFGGPFVAAPRWSPDGKQIVFACRPGANVDIYVLESGGGAPRRLTDHPAYDLAPSFSRDGRWIYFASNRTGPMQIWKMPATGGAATVVSGAYGNVPVESPDGHYLYYFGFDKTLNRISVEGGEPVQVLHYLSADYDWAVNNKGIYFIADEDSALSVSLRFLNFGSEKITRIIPITKRHYPGLALSPDGRSVLWAQYDQTNSDLMLVENSE